ncbi:MAG TPA: hypothetical protein VGM37_21140 [Armatimonadota bacterium]|jgi:hypothetical protein
MRLLAFCAFGLVTAAFAAPTRTPVKEITVFKDGHAFVLHEGRMPVSENGSVALDDLPTPVLGTFWTWSNEPSAKLNSVTAGQRRVSVSSTALTVRDLIEANPGAEVTVTETGGAKYEARIVGIPFRSPEELQAADPAKPGLLLPVKAGIVLLKTESGEMAVPLDHIQAVTFKGEHKPALADDQVRNRLVLRLDWSGQPAREANIGMMYVQKGLRWIPGYRVDVDGNGRAAVKFQATLVNELIDLNDVTANLVVGVPTFAMAGNVDPMALQNSAAQLGQYFDRDSRFNAFSNGIQSQVAGYYSYSNASGRPAAASDLGPEVTGSDKKEDFFIFTVRHVTLKRGERMVIPVAEYSLKYRDVYTVDIPFAPPPEVRNNYASIGQEQIARLAAGPKAEHKIRITNGKDHPFTTAPALIVSGGRVLGQGLMTYTPAGGEVDLPVTTAVDISVRKSEKETGRASNSARWNNEDYGRVDLAGAISLVNHKDKAVAVEVTRNVLGNVDAADHGGEVRMLNLLEDPDALPEGGGWWYNYNWPYWWHHFNGIGRVSWKLTLEPGGKADLGYGWHYFWR